MYIYLDHNVADDISKGRYWLKPSDPDYTWVYSNENLAEIRRSGQTRFLAVLKDLQTVEIALVLDQHFRLTGEARILPYRDPFEVYDGYIDAVSEAPTELGPNVTLLGRLFGADNQERVLTVGDDLIEQIKILLEPFDLYSDATRKEVEAVAADLTEFASGALQDVKELEVNREAFGCHKGRATILEEYDNPIEKLWKLIKGRIPNMSPDQFFGFDPIDKQGYREWPVYLGIVGCHTILNFLGYRPDKGLSKVEDLPGILSDGAHIGHGAYCQAIMSADKRLCAKAKAIYRYRNIGTRVFRWNHENGLTSA